MDGTSEDLLHNVSETDGTAKYNVYIKKAIACCIGDNHSGVVRNGTRLSSAYGDTWLVDCVSQLKRRYSTRSAYMLSLLWYDGSRDYSLEDYFLNLQMDEDDLMGRFKKRRNIDQQELFTSLGNEALSKRILITGRPGFGKTTLVKKLAYDWATLKHPHYLSNFDLLIVIHLRKLGGRSIAETLQQVLVLPPKELVLILQATDLEILFLLDGFDELSETRDVLQFIRAETEQYRCSSKMTILLTSRPHAVEALRMDFHRRLTIAGFNKENQVRYINLAMGRCSKMANTLLSRLRNNNFLSQLAQCPLMLHMLCCLHQDIDLTRVRRVTDLYVEIFTLIIRRYVRKYGEHPSLKDSKYIPGESILAKLGAVAFMYLCERIPLLRESELRRVYCDEEYNVLMRLDFLVGSKVPTKTGIMETEFELLHRTFTEFLSALHFAINYEHFEILEKKKTCIDLYGIRHYSKDVEIALADHETFFLCYFGLTRERSALNRFLKLPVQLATGKSVSVLNHLKNEVSVALWRECTTIVKYLDFDYGKDSISDLKSVLEESFLEELVLHVTPYCTLMNIKDVFEAVGRCQSLKSVFIFPKTQVYMCLTTCESGEPKSVIFYVDLGLTLDAITQFISVGSPAELSIRLVAETQYAYDITRNGSSHFAFQERNFIGLVVFDSSRSFGESNIFQESSPLVFELAVGNIVIRMAFRSCVYRFGNSHVGMEKKVVFFITPEQYTFLESHPSLSVFVKKGEILSPQRHV